MNQYPVKLFLLILTLNTCLLSGCGSEHSTGSSNSGTATNDETKNMPYSTAESAGTGDTSVTAPRR